MGEVSGGARSFLALAQSTAQNSTYRYRLGAVIVSGGRVRGLGYSKKRNNPANMSDHHIKLCSVHAEVDALRGIANLRRATCFVARLDAAGGACLAKPCDPCMAALFASGVTRVYWTIDAAAAGVARVKEAV
jgi:deoxycytidylate deaminase